MIKMSYNAYSAVSGAGLENGPFLPLSGGTMGGYITLPYKWSRIEEPSARYAASIQEAIPANTVSYGILNSTFSVPSQLRTSGTVKLIPLVHKYGNTRVIPATYQSITLQPDYGNQTEWTSSFDFYKLVQSGSYFYISNTILQIELKITLEQRKVYSSYAGFYLDYYKIENATDSMALSGIAIFL